MLNDLRVSERRVSLLDAGDRRRRACMRYRYFHRHASAFSAVTTTGPTGRLDAQLGGGGQDVLDHLGVQPQAGYVPIGSKSTDQQCWNLLGRNPAQRLRTGGPIDAVIDEVA